MRHSICVGHNINHDDGTSQYVPAEGWNFTSPDQLEAMLLAGIIGGYDVGRNRHGDSTYNVFSDAGRVDQEAFNKFQWIEDCFD